MVIPVVAERSPFQLDETQTGVEALRPKQRSFRPLCIGTPHCTWELCPPVLAKIVYGYGFLIGKTLAVSWRATRVSGIVSQTLQPGGNF
jgi:hypothetical protein